MTKIYKIESKCKNTLYLSRRKDKATKQYNIEEICVNFNDPESLSELLSLPKEDQIPI